MAPIHVLTKDGLHPTGGTTALIFPQLYPAARYDNFMHPTPHQHASNDS
jgi:hypothetical protein